MQENDNYIEEHIIKASYQIRMYLEIDDSEYNVTISKTSEARKYFIHNILNELDKSFYSVLFASDFLRENKDVQVINEKDKFLTSKLFQSKIDELSVWRRKLIEILVDLIGFRSTNANVYYLHYNLLHELTRKKKEYNDLTEFWGCKNQKLELEINDLKNLIDQLSLGLDKKKCWYCKNDKKTKSIKMNYPMKNNYSR